MTIRKVIVALVLALPGLPVWPVRAAEPEPPGRELYLRYCGACHGPEAKGDGIVGTTMEPKPRDLTLLARQNGGEFPLERVVKTIDDRDVLRAHGRPAMPVWGEVLSEELGVEGKKSSLGIERRVQGKILTIAEYLRTIQVK